MEGLRSSPIDLGAVLDRAVRAGTVRYVRVAPDGSVEELDAAHLIGAVVEGAQALRSVVEGRHAVTGLVPLVVGDPLAFVRAFFSVVQAGMTPVPLPGSPHVHARHLHRLESVLASCDADVVVSDCPDDTVAEALCRLGHDPLVLRPATGALRPGTTAWPPSPVSVRTDDVAYVQYTSGSLGTPTPVTLTHGNVVAQLEQAAAAFEETSAGTAVGWVPLHHDMGLVTSVLRPLWSGYRSVMIDPFDFIADPAMWMRELSRWGATHTSAPDFGYNLAARKAAGTPDLDLSRLRVARSAGEPVRAATLDAFTNVFAHAGFDRSAFNPSYGMAEATLTVTAGPVAAPPVVVDVDRSALRRGHVVDAAPSGRSTQIVSCGTPVPRTRVAVVGEDGRPVPDDVVGEVWISGPQVCVLERGAHRLFDEDGYLTADMGFLRAGHLFLLGRSRERFQVAGENFYSVDVETAATTADPRVRPGRGICVTAQVDSALPPVPTLLLELRDDTDLDDTTGRAIVRDVTAAVARQTGLSVRAVGLVRAGALPRTTSGKLQRDLGRVAVESGELDLRYWHRRGIR